MCVKLAAEETAFMFSVKESCSLNKINSESYFEDIFRSNLFGTNRDKRDFLPATIKHMNCKNEYS